MEKNQKCVVSSGHKFHSERVGYFQFYGKGESEGVAILTDKPTLPGNSSGNYFAVKCEDIQTM